jgi:hypothetical protein
LTCFQTTSGKAGEERRGARPYLAFTERTIGAPDRYSMMHDARNT